MNNCSVMFNTKNKEFTKKLILLYWSSSLELPLSELLEQTFSFLNK
uniref:Uncharacterized protein n=1 Tax=Anguilla anguilla TaxID=7936 RepID=A0A0E9QHJ1_ANGAN